MDRLYQKILLIILALAHTGIDVCRCSTVSVPLAPVTTTVGANFTIRCRINNSTKYEDVRVKRTVMEGNITEYIIYQSIPEDWKKKNFDKTKYSLNGSSKFDIEITVKKVTFQDAGTYTCEPFHFPHSRSSADVLVLGRPIVTLPNIVAGKSFQATCEVQFMAPPDITEGNSHFPELIGKVDDTEFNGTTEFINGSMEADLQNVLVKSMNITLTESSNGKNFWCIARTIKPSHEENSSKVLDFLFNVTQPELPDRYSYYPGEVINCSAEGNPDPTIEWKPVKSKINTKYNNFLPLINTMVGDSEEWTCEASNIIKGVSVLKKKKITFRVEPPEPPDVTPGWVVGLSVGISLVVVFVLIVLAWEWKIKKAIRKPRVQEKSLIKDATCFVVPPDDESSKAQVLVANSVENVKLGKKDKEFISKEDLLRYIKEIKGGFGKVYDQKLSQDTKLSLVDVKSMYGNRFKELTSFEAFLQEALKIKDFKNDYILSPLGIIYKQGNPKVILPYMENRNLRMFLAKKKTFEPEKLVSFCCDVAEGMNYLTSEGLTHPALTADNCTVDDQWHVRVGYFGLTCVPNEVPADMTLPIKWMAPESITKNEFTLESHVWSYGVVMWEVFTHGELPYKDLNDENVKNSIKKSLNEFKRLEKPKDCPSKIYSMMCQCWHEDPDKRPRFSDMITILKTFLSTDL